MLYCAQLYDFVRKNGLERHVVVFAADSVCTTKKLSIDSVRLGDFSFEGKLDDTTYLQNEFSRFAEGGNSEDLAKLIESKERNKIIVYYLVILAFLGMLTVIDYVNQS